MPMYDFETPTGEVVEHFFPMAQSPKIGDTVEINGVQCTRLMSDCQTSVRADVQPFVSRTLPPHDPRAPRQDKKGRAVFHGKREVEEYIAKTEGQFAYDK